MRDEPLRAGAGLAEGAVMLRPSPFPSALPRSRSPSPARPSSYTPRPKGTPSMQVIATEGAPKAIGPYSQAIRVGDWLYTSGQVALDPTTGELAGPDFAVQARRVFENLKAVLGAAGVTFSHVVKATVY